ncbi:hypothetical protein BT69DRAFT_1349484 [Atractiella rhizophila]|nr:hypothetical protein BT69DRAFT_1349484 [Atractiella rhizophila]
MDPERERSRFSLGASDESHVSNYDWQFPIQNELDPFAPPASCTGTPTSSIRRSGFKTPTRTPILSPSTPGEFASLFSPEFLHLPSLPAHRPRPSTADSQSSFSSGTVGKGSVRLKDSFLFKNDERLKDVVVRMESEDNLAARFREGGAAGSPPLSPTMISLESLYSKEEKLPREQRIKVLCAEETTPTLPPPSIRTGSNRNTKLLPILVHILAIAIFGFSTYISFRPISFSSVAKPYLSLPPSLTSLALVPLSILPVTLSSPYCLPPLLLRILGPGTIHLVARLEAEEGTELTAMKGWVLGVLALSLISLLASLRISSSSTPHPHRPHIPFGFGLRSTISLLALISYSSLTLLFHFLTVSLSSPHSITVLLLLQSGWTTLVAAFLLALEHATREMGRWTGPTLASLVGAIILVLDEPEGEEQRRLQFFGNWEVLLAALAVAVFSIGAEWAIVRLRSRSR